MDDLARALEGLGLRRQARVNAAGRVYELDFASDDHRVIVEIKRGQGGARDLYAAMLKLAMCVPETGVERAILLFDGARMSADGLREGWSAVRRVLAPEVADHLCLVALLDGTLVTLPEEDPFLREVGKRAAEALGTIPRHSRVDRSFEVMRVLLSRWLQRRGPITVKDLQEQTGLSHPSVSKGIAEIEGAVERRRDRSVTLREFPSEGWGRLLALAPRVRQTAAFVDESGRGTDPARLLERVQRIRLGQVAVAGVAGARHWHAAFDLHGLPRLDLTVHAPDRAMDTTFVERLDPALVPAPRGAPTVLVVHAVPRADSLFMPDPHGVALWADPVEVLLDLHEMRLGEQADELVRALRSVP